MDGKPKVLVAAGSVGVLQGLVALGPTPLFDDPTAGFPWWLPTFETIGTTVVAYLYLFRVLAFVVSPLAALAVGYWLAGSLDLHRQLRAFLGRFAAGALAGVALARAAVVLVAFPGLVPGPEAVALAVVPAVGAAVKLVIAALAGAALAHFRAESPPGAASTARPAGGTTGD